MYLRISKFLEKLSFKLKQKSLYFELKYYIKSGKSYFKPVYSYTRGIGKTYTLIQLAHKYKCPIITNAVATGKYIERTSKELRKSVEVFGCNSYALCGKRFKMILCEEDVDIEQINRMKIYYSQIVGYKFIG